jgi:hypothetical protein
MFKKSVTEASNPISGSYGNEQNQFINHAARISDRSEMVAFQYFVIMITLIVHSSFGVSGNSWAIDEALGNRDFSQHARLLLTHSDEKTNTGHVDSISGRKSTR